MPSKHHRGRLTARMVRNARTRWGISQSQLAQLMGGGDGDAGRYTSGYVANVETGRAKLTSEFRSRFFRVEFKFEPDELRSLRTLIDYDKKATMMTGVLYLIRAKGTSAYKIGISTEIKNRLRSIQSNSPIELELLCLHEADELKMLENIAHLALERYRMWGEWFNLTENKAAKLIEILS